MIRKIHNHPRIVTNWGNHKSDTMAKVQHFSGISKRIPFEGFDFYDLFSERSPPSGASGRAERDQDGIRDI